MLMGVQPSPCITFWRCMGGQINTIQRVLEAMFAELGKTQLTHELLVMLMAEVAAIVNTRLISALPSDPDDPHSLSPAMLLTMKTHPTGPPPGQFLPPDIYVRYRWRSSIPGGAVLDEMATGVPAELAAPTKVDRDTAGPVCRRCCPHAR